MKKRYAVLLAAALLLSGCNTKEPVQPEITTITNAGAAILSPLVTDPDPHTAIEKIYESIQIEDVAQADARDLSRRFSIDSALVEDFAVQYTSGKFGLANVFFLKPKSEQDAPKLRDQLEQVKLSISRETEHYDIHNSYQIAQDAQIFEQGGYMIMLMLADTEAARNIVDLYIPKN